MKGESNGSRWECVAEGVYRDKWSKKGNLYERPVVDGNPTFRSLHTSNLEEAQALLKARRTDQLRAEVGLADDPYKKANLTTVGEVVRQYQKDDYPDRLREARPERTRAIEAANCETLLGFFDALPVEDLRPSTLDNYFDWRRKGVKEGATGRRSTDMELNTLNNAMLWAHRRELIRFNPMPHSRPRYNSSRHVKHCRESCPADANILHQFAKFLFQVPGRSVGSTWLADADRSNDRAPDMRGITVAGQRQGRRAGLHL